MIAWSASKNTVAVSGTAALVVSLVIIATLSAPAAVAATDWPQWGGPERSFRATGTPLADSWTESAPELLWNRELGDGYSAITVVGNRLYTMARDGEEERVVALAADSGDLVWEHRYPAPILEGMRIDRGAGPQSTPLFIGNRVFSVGATAKFTAVDAATGKLLWSHDLIADFGGSLLNRGYGASPIAYGDTVILPVGGKGHAVMAFAQSDGQVVWQRQDFDGSPASPILIDLDGQQQLVVFMTGVVAGLDPADGSLFWSHPHPIRRYFNISTPVWGPDRVLFLSSAYGAGSRGLRLTREGETTRVEELWYTDRMHVHFTNALRLGDHVYASSGDFTAVLLTAIDVHTGEVAWKERGVSRANLLHADGKVIALDEDGRLFLLKFSPVGLEQHGQMQLFDGLSWTVPTLVGKTLYARDLKRAVALKLP